MWGEVGTRGGCVQKFQKWHMSLLPLSLDQNPPSVRTVCEADNESAVCLGGREDVISEKVSWYLWQPPNHPECVMRHPWAVALEALRDELALHFTVMSVFFLGIWTMGSE